MSSDPPRPFELRVRASAYWLAPADYELKQTVSKITYSKNFLPDGVYSDFCLSFYVPSTTAVEPFLSAADQFPAGSTFRPVRFNTLQECGLPNGTLIDGSIINWAEPFNLDEEEPEFPAPTIW
jgi:hypothetical protein